MDETVDYLMTLIASGADLDAIREKLQQYGADMYILGERHSRWLPYD